MIAEKTDPDLPSPTATRVRVMLDPGQVAGLDSEEGRSLSLTCGEDAATLVVSYGERDKLMARKRPPSRDRPSVLGLALKVRLSRFMASARVAST
jgi:hypothetical protein